MNLKDEEWDPPPTDTALLRRVRAATQACVSTHDLASLRQTLLAAPCSGAIPHEVRGAVWLLLLRLRAEALLSEDAAVFAQHARESVTDANSREQIEKDVARTRPALARFKQPPVRGALLRLLSLFCKRRKVAYVQGFNELLAPFVLLADTGGNPRIVFALFSEFVSTFAPWILETSESRVFDVLKRMFKYFGRLLLYHDPELYWLLERHSMSPDLYATSWFVTLFARNFTIESVVALWDLLLLEDNPLGTIFFGIALLCSKREQLLSVDESSIPEALMLLTADSPDEVRRLWKIGSTMRVVHTPPSFQRLMTDRLLHASGSRTKVALSAARSMQASVCLQTTTEDLIAGDAHHFTWDCRTHAEYNAGHLAQAAYLPLDALRAANGKITNETSESARMELQAAVDLCEPLKDSSHICLVGSGIREEDNMDINMLALYLTRIGIRYVSTLRGGFQEALAAFNSDATLNPVELVDYDQNKYEHARKARVNAHARRSQGAARNSLVSGTSVHGGDGITASPVALQNSGDSLAVGNSGAPSPRQPETSPTGQSIAAFLEKTDAEVSRALSRALHGIGLKYSLSSLGSGFSTEQDNAQNDTAQDAASSPVPSAFPSCLPSPGKDAALVEPASVTKPSPALKRAEGRQPSQNLKSEPSLHRSLSSMNNPSGRWVENQSGRRNGAATVENSPRLMETPSHAMSPKPGVQVDLRNVSTESPIRQQKNRNSSNGFFGVQRSPWGRDAKPGWLGDDTLRFPLSAMSKGFTVNVMDDRVMGGLRLFPCKARSDRSMGLRGRSNEFKKRYVGVSANYFLLLSPHSNRSHLLEVKVIRYLQDISRITFKRSRPEVVTFEVLTAEGEGAVPESIVCLMPDGLKECVALIKDYLSSQGVENEGEGTGVRERDMAAAENTSEARAQAKDGIIVGGEKKEDIVTPRGVADDPRRIAGVRNDGSTRPQFVGDAGKVSSEKAVVQTSKEESADFWDADVQSESPKEAECMEFGEFQAAPARSDGR